MGRSLLSAARPLRDFPFAVHVVSAATVVVVNHVVLFERDDLWRRVYVFAELQRSRTNTEGFEEHTSAKRYK